MNEDYTTAEDLSNAAEASVTDEQVAAYLHHNPEFFLNWGELLANIKLPHDSGKAISLVEKQVNILRKQGIETRKKLNDLIQVARSNDMIFDAIRTLILALLNSNTIEEISISIQEQFTSLENIDACEMVFVDHPNLTKSGMVRSEKFETLKQEYSDAFRLKKTYCGQLENEQLLHLFPMSKGRIVSTALCPVVNNDQAFGLLALGNKTTDHFNVHLDTLFLDFICQTLGIVIGRKLMASDSGNLI